MIYSTFQIQIHIYKFDINHLYAHAMLNFNSMSGTTI